MSAWLEGNSISLLENGDEFFPRIIEVIDKAQQEVLLETFIWLDDPVGTKIKASLIAAAKRGVWVSVVVDGYGSHYFPQKSIDELRELGIHFCMYHSQPKWLLVRLNVFKRMHRKLLVVDGETAFIGGINLAYNQTSSYGPNFKQDYAAELRGPVVHRIRRFMQSAAQSYTKESLEFIELPERSHTLTSPSDIPIRFVARDNEHQRTTIERQFLLQMHRAQKKIAIANPYFFPGYRVLRELRKAARRGVKVQLLVQGKLGSPLAKWGAESLYDFLVESGVEVYEYWERQLHGKIAAIDNEWATIGSSNLDPLSLSLNLEANVFVRDREFNALISDRILKLMEGTKARQVKPSWIHRRTLIKWFRSFLLYHFFRHFPGMADWLPPAELPRRTSRWRHHFSRRKPVGKDEDSTVTHDPK